MDDSAPPESFLRRLLWRNSGLLCLVTLLTLPIIIGVAIGYIIVLAIVTSYKKITGQKSREEKEEEAAKKIRVVLGHDLMDSAFTKPVQLPGQQKNRVTRMPRYGSVSEYSSVRVSMDENESLGEAIIDEVESKTEMDVQDGREIGNIQECSNDSGKASNSSETNESCTESSRAAKESSAECSRATNQSSAECSQAATESCAESSRTINESSADSSRAASASSEYYSTASEMEEPTERCHGDDTAQDHQERQKKHGDAVLEVSSRKSPAKPVLQNTKSLPQQSVAVIPRNEILSTSQVKPFMPVALGKLKYSVKYLKDRNQLQVTILKAINLFYSSHDPEPSSFVKVCLLPQRFCWQRTTVIEKTRNPVYNETFVISGFSRDRFAGYTLLICVVNAVTQWQGYYGDYVVGEILVPLINLAKNTDNDEKEMLEWAELKPKMAETPGLSKCGKINLALCYRPISGRLIVTIKKAKELKCQSRETFDPYVKIALYCDGTRVGRGATRVKRRVTNPVFNEKFNFDLSSDQIAYTTLVIKVVNNIESTPPACLGATVIGYESSGDGQEHWLCMMECLSQHVDAWHTLYD